MVALYCSIIIPLPGAPPPSTVRWPTLPTAWAWAASTGLASALSAAATWTAPTMTPRTTGTAATTRVRLRGRALRLRGRDGLSLRHPSATTPMSPARVVLCVPLFDTDYIHVHTSSVSISHITDPSTLTPVFRRVWYTITL